MEKTYLTLAAFLILGITGQFLFKTQMNKTGAIKFDISIIKIFFKPLIIAGLLCYGLATICWLSVLSKLELSLAYPLMSLSYVLVILVGIIFFKEKVTLSRWFGVILICIGVIFISAT